jgi:aminopeptidase 2
LSLLLRSQIYSTVYSHASKSEQTPTGQSFDKAQERTAFELSSPLSAGSKAEIKIAFSGGLTGSMMGYYKSSYEHEGKTINYALTQFEVCHSCQSQYSGR